MNSVSTTFVLPVFNGVAYLDEAVQSVLNQTHQDWHLLLIDDASTDGSAERIREYEDPRVRAITHTNNAGLYPRLRQAIEEELSTDWVVILMQDDRLYQDYLGELHRLVRKYPVAAAIWASHDDINELGITVGHGVDSGCEQLILPGVGPWQDALRRGCFWIISGSLTRRELILRAPFRRDLPHCGDYDWLLRTLRLAPFLHYERPLLDIRFHAGQASARNLPKGIDLSEKLQIFREQFAAYGADARRELVRSTVRPPAVHAARRMARACLEGRVIDAARFSVIAWQFLNFRAEADR